MLGICLQCLHLAGVNSNKHILLQTKNRMQRTQINTQAFFTYALNLYKSRPKHNL